jgi:hypothetical protein
MEVPATKLTVADLEVDLLSRTVMAAASALKCNRANFVCWNI